MTKAILRWILESFFKVGVHAADSGMKCACSTAFCQNGSWHGLVQNLIHKHSSRSYNRAAATQLNITTST